MTMKNVSLITQFITNKHSLIIQTTSKGYSMEPLIKHGAKVVLKLNYSQEYKVGDIVAFKKNNQIILHRLMAIKKKYVITKGDNKLDYDNQVDIKKLMGKAIKIIYPSHTIFLENNRSRFFVFILTWYSRLNHHFPNLLKIKNLYKYPFLKHLYRKLISS